MKPAPGDHRRMGRAAAPSNRRAGPHLTRGSHNPRVTRSLQKSSELWILNVEDRYGSDVQFCDRVHQEGRAVKECILDDMLAFANLPDPPRTRAQLSAGVAANAEHEHLLTKLVYFSHARGPEGFPHEFRTDFTKVWGYITPVFGRQLHRLPEDEPSSQSPSHMEGGCQGAESGCGELPGRCIREKSAPRQTELGAKAEPIQYRKETQGRRRSPTTSTSKLRASGCPII